MKSIYQRVYEAMCPDDCLDFEDNTGRKGAIISEMKYVLDSNTPIEKARDYLMWWNPDEEWERGGCVRWIKKARKLREKMEAETMKRGSIQ